MKIYYNKDQALQGRLICLGIDLSEEELENLTNYVIYESNDLFIGYPIVDGDILRQATDRELVEQGILPLAEGEKLVGDSIVKVPRPNQYPFAYNWNGEEWELDLSKLPRGVVYNGETFDEIPLPKEYLEYHWEYPKWVNDTTDKDIVRNSLNDYMKLNNWLDGEEMKEEGVFEDYKKYIKECRDYLRNKNNIMPTPSPILETFYHSKY